MEMLQWIIQIEEIAGQLYTEAADYFRKDADLSNFLEKLADDENKHHQLLHNFKVQSGKSLLSNLSVTMDQDTFHKFRYDLSGVRKMMNDRKLSRKVMLEKVIDLEFSEWNDYFLYVVSVLKSTHRQLVNEIKNIQNHRNRVIQYCEPFPEFAEKIKQLKSRPPVWLENILIVEDETIVSELLQRVLSGKGDIDFASNGREGLERVQHKYYKLIISDIDMPVMDGLRFFETACRMFPNINRRFLFFTGNMTEDKKNFLDNHGVSYMLKPASLRDIKNSAERILTKH